MKVNFLLPPLILRLNPGCRYGQTLSKCIAISLGYLGKSILEGTLYLGPLEIFRYDI